MARVLITLCRQARRLALFWCLKKEAMKSISGSSTIPKPKIASLAPLIMCGGRVKLVFHSGDTTVLECLGYGSPYLLDKLTA